MKNPMADCYQGLKIILNKLAGKAIYKKDVIWGKMKFDNREYSAK